MAQRTGESLRQWIERLERKIKSNLVSISNVPVITSTGGTFAFADLPADKVPGTIQIITDANTTTIGAFVTSGGGADTVVCVWSGSRWVIISTV